MKTFLGLKEGFEHLVKSAEPPVLHAFIFWLDGKLAEFKVYGYLDCSNAGEECNNILSDQDENNKASFSHEKTIASHCGLKLPCLIQEQDTQPDFSYNNAKPQICQIASVHSKLHDAHQTESPVLLLQQNLAHNTQSSVQSEVNLVKITQSSVQPQLTSAHQTQSSVPLQLNPAHQLQSSVHSQLKLVNQKQLSIQPRPNLVHQTQSSVPLQLNSAHQTQSSVPLQLNSANQLQSSVHSQLKLVNQKHLSIQPQPNLVHQMQSSVPLQLNLAHQTQSSVPLQLNSAHQTQSSVPLQLNSAYQTQSSVPLQLNSVHQMQSSVSSQLNFKHQSQSEVHSQMNRAHHTSTVSSISILPTTQKILMSLSNSLNRAVTNKHPISAQVKLCSSVNFQQQVDQETQPDALNGIQNGYTLQNTPLGDQFMFDEQKRILRAQKRGPPKLIAFDDDEPVSKWQADEDVITQRSQYQASENPQQNLGYGINEVTQINTYHTTEGVAVSPEAYKTNCMSESSLSQWDGQVVLSTENSENGIDLSCKVQVKEVSSNIAEISDENHNEIYKCQICSKILLNSAGYNQHLRTHVIYSCQKCHELCEGKHLKSHQCFAGSAKLSLKDNMETVINSFPLNSQKILAKDHSLTTNGFEGNISPLLFKDHDKAAMNGFNGQIPIPSSESLLSIPNGSIKQSPDGFKHNVHVSLTNKDTGTAKIPHSEVKKFDGTTDVFPETAQEVNVTVDNLTPPETPEKNCPPSLSKFENGFSGGLNFTQGVATIQVADEHAPLSNCWKELSCPICSKSFLHLSSLNRHLKVHQGVFTHACAVCGRRFTRNEHFVQHKCGRRPKDPNRLVENDRPLEEAAKLVAFPPSMAMALVEQST